MHPWSNSLPGSSRIFAGFTLKSLSVLSLKGAAWNLPGRPACMDRFSLGLVLVGSFLSASEARAQPCPVACSGGEVCVDGRCASKPDPSAPDPGASPASGAASQKASTRFFLSAGGIAVPDTVNAVVGGAGLVFPSSDWGRDLRLQVAGFRVSVNNTVTTGGILLGSQNLWWGVYGLALGLGAGYASAERSSGGGGTSAFSVYAVPVQLRFGANHRVEAGLTTGIIRFVDIEELNPWGYLWLNFLL